MKYKVKRTTFDDLCQIDVGVLLLDFPINILDSFKHQTQTFKKNEAKHFILFLKVKFQRLPLKENICFKNLSRNLTGRLRFDVSKIRAQRRFILCHYVKSMESIIRCKCINRWILMPILNLQYVNKYLQLTFYIF